MNNKDLIEIEVTVSVSYSKTLKLKIKKDENDLKKVFDEQHYKPSELLTGSKNGITAISCPSSELDGWIEDEFSIIKD